jgi:hypothetical protein
MEDNAAPMVLGGCPRLSEVSHPLPAIQAPSRPDRSAVWWRATDNPVIIFRSLAAEKLRHPVSRRKHAKTDNAALIRAGSPSINAKLPD